MDNPILGKLLPASETRRDAIHVAIIPVVSDKVLIPGQHVGLFKRDGADFVVGAHDKDHEPVGIIDPFLTEVVEPGQKCWLCLYQSSITSLRHMWTHPAFSAIVPMS
jgi:hypothetical protein